MELTKAKKDKQRRLSFVPSKRTAIKTSKTKVETYHPNIAKGTND